MSHQSELIASDILEYLKQHENKELLRLLTCGSVDDGKSTLIGRLLHDSKMIYEDQLAAVTNDSKKMGTTGDRPDLALLVDGLQAEREQGITIDVAYRYFSTSKRKFIIADTPGHEQYTRNMATGASTCDLAIILIDARHGVLTQTRRHSFIASLLGIQHIVVAINKMDLVEYNESRFEEIRQQYLEFSRQLNLKDIRFVPISALEGDNVVNRSEHMPWYQGETLMELMENVQISADKNLQDFRMPVQWVNRPNLNFRGFSGTISSGIVNVGDQVIALPSGKSSTVKSIVTYDGELDSAFIGQAVTLTLNDEIDISRGDLLVKKEHQPLSGHGFSANLVWMTESPMEPGKQYDIKLGTSYTSGVVQNIQYKTDVNTLEQQQAQRLELNEIGTCDVVLSKAVSFDPYNKNRQTGAFIMIDRLTNVTVGAGMIVGKSSYTNQSPVGLDERLRRFGQKSGIIKVANAKLAHQLDRHLFDTGHLSVVAEKINQQNATLALQAGVLILTPDADSFDLKIVDETLDAALIVLQQNGYIH
ncbi:sulfate adenylyltransferase subunit CysN [Gynuella sunshinyii]|uniref:Sulfate adenylyltransferase subunit 1 n=1 Tax=Gynuella sunshinyii YC6258 TaxID=1445510 RepID=A0A0C5VQF2_9GAMM|nr:sulfate adenylyltransferase subunit CysN [Gynuella sunshinyii]AJQ96496.1 GTPase - Sulfate adenylate transferase subunit 1 [Gynuella sunshinyii YC6258]